MVKWDERRKRRWRVRGVVWYCAVLGHELICDPAGEGDAKIARNEKKKRQYQKGETRAAKRPEEEGPVCWPGRKVEMREKMKGRITHHRESKNDKSKPSTPSSLTCSK